MYFFNTPHSNQKMLGRRKRKRDSESETEVNQHQWLAICLFPFLDGQAALCWMLTSKTTWQSGLLVPESLWRKWLVAKLGPLPMPCAFATRFSALETLYGRLCQRCGSSRRVVLLLPFRRRCCSACLHKCAATEAHLRRLISPDHLTNLPFWISPNGIRYYWKAHVNRSLRQHQVPDLPSLIFTRMAIKGGGGSILSLAYTKAIIHRVEENWNF